MVASDGSGCVLGPATAVGGMAADEALLAHACAVAAPVAASLAVPAVHADWEPC